MLTARDAVEDRIAGLDTGRGRLPGQALRPRRTAGAGARPAAARPCRRLPVLRVGDLTLDPATRRVAGRGREIILSAKEYALLEYLMRHAGQTVARTLIMEHVWDFDFDSGTNVVDVYINYLRNKVDRGHDVQTDPHRARRRLPSG